MMAKMSIQHQIRQGNAPGHQFKLSCQHGLDAQQFGRQDDFAGHFVLAPFGLPARARLSRLGRSFGHRLGLTGRLFGLAAHDLVNAHWKRAAWLGADQGRCEKGQTWNHSALQAGKEAIQPMRAIARLAHHHFITGQEVDLVWSMQMLAAIENTQNSVAQGRTV